ncbi:MAG TPA: AraC family transcriptional regulator, partial [Cytophaga sp.]|nr:AraC family transcriptional regulator [Cytophaga sp.]
MKTANKKIYLHFLLQAILPVGFMWLIVLVIYLNTTTIEILKDNQSIPYNIYTDQELQGHSIASADKVQSQGLIFSSILKKGYSYPYTGICFVPDSGMLSLNSNSIFTVELMMETAGIIPFILNEYITDAAGKTVMRPVQYELKTKPGTHRYVIPLEEFTVPSWWYKNNQFSESDLPAFNSSNVKNICMQNSSLAVMDKEERIVIKQITNAPDTHSWIWIASFFSFCWTIGYVIHTTLKKKRTRVFIPYIATTTEEKTIDEWEQVRTYISANYMNDMDMEGMEKELGIAKHKIALLIKDNTTLIFKQYLNQIKVAEAKRLLLETSLPIGEIADQVGFGHLSNFNRVFKQYTGESPS